jgi:hypothetical protein
MERLYKKPKIYKGNSMACKVTLVPPQITRISAGCDAWAGAGSNCDSGSSCCGCCLGSMAPAFSAAPEQCCHGSQASIVRGARGVRRSHIIRCVCGPTKLGVDGDDICTCCISGRLAPVPVGGLVLSTLQPCGKALAIRVAWTVTGSQVTHSVPSVYPTAPAGAQRCSDPAAGQPAGPHAVHPRVAHQQQRRATGSAGAGSWLHVH